MVELVRGMRGSGLPIDRCQLFDYVSLTKLYDNTQFFDLVV